jgi:hypothetical protein
MVKNAVENPVETISDFIQIPKGQFAFIKLTIHKDPLNTISYEIFNT